MTHVGFNEAPPLPICSPRFDSQLLESSITVNEDNLFRPDSQASAAPRAATANGIRLLLVKNLAPTLRPLPSQITASPRAATTTTSEEVFYPDSQIAIVCRRCLRDHLLRIRLLPTEDWPSTLRPLPPLEGRPTRHLATTYRLPDHLNPLGQAWPGHLRLPPRHLRCPPPCLVLPLV
uniref:Uncharacterized protein n=1 Tax=Oryza punctata TaxID=4537 RepID=A0A0E0LWT7_ORYPU